VQGAASAFPAQRERKELKGERGWILTAHPLFNVRGGGVGGGGGGGGGGDSHGRKAKKGVLLNDLLWTEWWEQ